MTNIQIITERFAGFPPDPHKSKSVGSVDKKWGKVNYAHYGENIFLII
jgi:hypothetical protein